MDEREQELVARAQTGDQSAFDELVRPRRAAHVAYAATMVGAADAEDVVQRAWLSAWKNLSGYQPKGSFGGWLRMIVSNAALDWLRKRKRRPVFADVDPNEFAGANVPPEHDDIDALRQCMEKTPEPFRSAVVRGKLQGWSHADIAKEQDCTLGTVGSRISRGVAALRECIERRRP